MADTIIIIVFGVALVYCNLMVFGLFERKLEKLQQELRDIRSIAFRPGIDHERVIEDTRITIKDGLQGLREQFVIANRKLESLVSEIRRITTVGAPQ